MACANPVDYYNRHNWQKDKYLQYRYSYGIQIPCGMCLNCRVDRRNQWADRAKYEYCKRLTGSFVTLTYSDLWYHKILKNSPKDGKLKAHLIYDDVRKFIARLRKYIKYHPEIQGVLAQPDFSYIYVGEYGEKGAVFERPHFHVLFFGLDFAFIRKILVNEWKYGFIDVLPILDGGINYVLKYMDKQQFGTLAKEKYDVHLLARPKQGQSRSFGTGLYKTQKQDIQENGYTYNAGKNIRRPIPVYFKKVLFGTDMTVFSDKHSLNALHTANTRLKEKMHTTYRLQDLSVYAKNNFKLEQSRIRERKLRQMLLNDGVGVYDYVTGNDIYGFRYKRDRIRKLPDSILHWLSSDYINSLQKELANG